MAFASGTQTATVTTEHKLSGVNVPGIFRLIVDVSAMVAGDVLELRAYQMVLTSGTARVIRDKFITLYGAQLTDELIVTLGDIDNDLTDTDALKFTLKQTFGTGRAFPWKVMNLVPTNFLAQSIDSNGRVDVIKVAGTTQTAGDLANMITEVDDFVDTEVAAIKAKTDNLPANTATEFATLNTKIDAVDDFVDTEVAAILAAVDTEVAAIKAKTDSLTFSAAGKVDANLKAIEGDLTSGNNATLKLAGLDIQATSTNHAVNITAVDGIGIAVDSANNRGAVFGSTNGVGLDLYSENSNALRITSDADNAVSIAAEFDGVLIVAQDNGISVNASEIALALNSTSSVSVNAPQGILGSDGVDINMTDIAASGGGGLDAAGVRAAVGLASANLDTQFSTVNTKLNTIDDFVDTEVAAILAAVDTEVGAIKTKTDQLAFTVTGRVDATTQSLAIKKNTALNNFEFLMRASGDHITPATGLTVTATRSIDGGAFASCTNSVTAVGNGVYKINLSAADLNGDVITLKFTATGGDQRTITLVTQA